jgi:hypothetical protein
MSADFDPIGEARAFLNRLQEPVATLHEVGDSFSTYLWLKNRWIWANDEVGAQIYTWMAWRCIVGSRRRHKEILIALQALTLFSFGDDRLHDADDLPSPAKVRAYLARREPRAVVSVAPCADSLDDALQVDNDTLDRILSVLDPCRHGDDWHEILRALRTASGGDEDMRDHFVEWCAASPPLAHLSRQICAEWHAPEVFDSPGLPALIEAMREDGYGRAASAMLAAIFGAEDERDMAWQAKALAHA